MALLTHWTQVWVYSDIVKKRKAWHVAVHGGHKELDMTEQLNNGISGFKQHKFILIKSKIKGLLGRLGSKAESVSGGVRLPGLTP